MVYGRTESPAALGLNFYFAILSQTLSAIPANISAQLLLCLLMFSEKTITVYSGSSAGKKPQNQPSHISLPFSYLPVCAVAVFPAALTVLGFAAVPVPSVITALIFKLFSNYSLYFFAVLADMTLVLPRSDTGVNLPPDSVPETAVGSA